MNIFEVGLTIWIYMTIWFFIAMIKKRNDIADIAWGLGFPLIASVSLLFKVNLGIYDYIVLILTLIWGLRLSLHIHFRNIAKKEDYRYLAWRKEWGKYFFVRSYIQIFILQGLFMGVISIPLFINHSNSTLNVFSLFSILVWIVGFVFESVSDKQLKTFVNNKNNKGKIMKTGLWKYSRHPNYFGEVTQWWGIFFISTSFGLNLITLSSPILITFLILFVSGIPLLEKKYDGNTEFQEYKSKTSVFIPMLPRK